MTERHRDDKYAEQEERLAAEEARGIGGTPTRELDADLPHDPASRPVYEAGGGEQEGFEMAEEELRENAEHGPRDPEAQVRAVRAEVDRETEEEDRAVYGEADEEEVSEVTFDPEDPDAPDAGPGMSRGR